MNYQNIVFSSHAIQRMFSRKISKQAVTTVIATGTQIESYPDDTPFPSYLILGFIDENPLHVVYSYDESTGIGYVITAYIPTPERWQNNFSNRI